MRKLNATQMRKILAKLYYLYTDYFYLINIFCLKTSFILCPKMKFCKTTIFIARKTHTTTTMYNPTHNLIRVDLLGRITNKVIIILRFNLRRFFIFYITRL